MIETLRHEATDPLGDNSKPLDRLLDEEPDLVKKDCAKMLLKHSR